MNRLAHQKRQADVAAQAERLAASARGEEVYWDSDDVESATSSQLSGQDFFEQIDEDVGGLSQEDEDVASDVNAGAPFDTSRRSPNENELEAQDIASPSGVQRNVARAPSSPAKPFEGRQPSLPVELQLTILRQLTDVGHSLPADIQLWLWHSARQVCRRYRGFVENDARNVWVSKARMTVCKPFGSPSGRTLELDFQGYVGQTAIFRPRNKPGGKGPLDAQESLLDGSWEGSIFKLQLGKVVHDLRVTGMTFAQPHYITVPWKAFVSQLIYEEARIRQVLEVARAHPVIKTIHGPDPSDEDTGPS